MLFSKFSLLAAAAAVGIASAATTTSSAATPSGSVKAHVVQVSDKNGDITFTPDSITAAPGELVQFQFYPQNHSVAQSTFANPCEPMPLTNGTEGFWSGFMPVSSTDTTMPVFSVLVKDTNPIWFYCAADKHCQAGMSGVINPPDSTSKTLALYRAAAANVADTGIPDTAAGTGGDDASSGSSSSSASASASATTGTGSSSSTSASSSQQTSANAGSSLLASSALALVVAGVAAALSF